MSYQVAKEIGAMATVLHGDVDGIILTGGIANNPMVVEYIKKMVSFIAPVIIYPGEDEMHALAMNGLRVLKGELEAREYNEENLVKPKLPNQNS
jgi:butyrate kinase